MTRLAKKWYELLNFKDPRLREVRLRLNDNTIVRWYVWDESLAMNWGGGVQVNPFILNHNKIFIHIPKEDIHKKHKGNAEEGMKKAS